MNAPLILAWELTKACNLECMHCRANASPDRDPDELTTNEGKGLLKELSTLGTKMVILSGGEALIRNDALLFARFGTSLGLRMTLATNGSTITRDSANEIKASGISRVSVSLDGITPYIHDEFRGRTGAYELALRGIDYLRSAGVPVQINTTVAAVNVSQMRMFPEFIKKLGASAWHVFFLVPTGRGHEMELATMLEYKSMLTDFLDVYISGSTECKATCAPQFYRMMSESGYKPVTKGCLAGDGFGFVSSTGDIQPCGFLDIKCGNVKKKRFSEIWHSSDVLVNLRNTDLLDGKCGTCNHKNICGGCRARAYEITGNINSTDPICWFKDGQ
jgi:radical SAM protein with 4Fe4S-binding SPASM domain